VSGAGPHRLPSEHQLQFLGREVKAPQAAGSAIEHFWFEDAGFTLARARGQYLLARSDGPIPEGWDEHRRHGWTLGVSKLPVVAVGNGLGEELGWCIGYVLLAGHPPPRRLLLDTARSDSIDSDSINTFYETVFGRYVLILLLRKEERIYLDPYGSLATVYSQSEPIVASTPTLLGSAYSWNVPLITALRMPNSGLWFPGTLTARAGIRRLLPNHFLDLMAWRVARHWPRDHRDLSIGPNVADTVKTIVVALKGVVSSAASQSLIYLPLTAGRDSRMLLACAREHLRAMSCFTFREGRVVTVDTHVTKELARRHGLEHVLLDIRYATREELRRWLYLTGHSVSGEAWRIHKRLEGLDSNRRLLKGFGGEVGRGFFWLEGDAPRMTITAANLLKRSGMPPQAALVTEIEVWVKGLAGLTALDVLDLYYLEHRLGGWAGPHHYGGWVSGIELSPFNQRGVFASMLKLPYEYRWKNSSRMTCARASGRSYWRCRSMSSRVPGGSFGVSSNVARRPCIRWRAPLSVAFARC